MTAKHRTHFFFFSSLDAAPLSGTEEAYETLRLKNRSIVRLYISGVPHRPKT